jgi:HEAT repeat protein
LIKLLKDNDSRVRANAAHQLARLADRRSAEALAQALGDSHANVRRWAAEGLARIGDERHVPALVRAVVNHLPDPNTDERESRSCIPALEVIGKLSSKAPAEIVALLSRIQAGRQMSEDWWRLLEAAALSLAEIADPGTYEPLQQAREALEETHQDYRTWYAVCEALAAIDPENMAFDRPATDILYSVRPTKITQEGIKRRWVRPLAEQGETAIVDLDWALKFDGRRDSWRKRVALEALGEIGGRSAATALRWCIQRICDFAQADEELQHPHPYHLRTALLALLKAEPTEETTEEISVFSQILDSFRQKHLMRDILNLKSHKVPERIKISLYKNVVLRPKGQKPLGERASAAAAESLAKIAGPKAGQVLSRALLHSDDDSTKEAAAYALGTIQDYDPVPSLLEAATMQNAPLGAIGKALGKRNDRRAVHALQTMMDGTGLSPSDRVWVAAALARLGKDCEQNAGIVREALPRSLEAAQWLHDKKTIDAVARFIEREDDHTRHRAIQALEAIGTEKAFDTLKQSIDPGQIGDPRVFQQLCEAAGRMADKLGHESTEYCARAAVSKAVLDWSEMQQRALRQPEASDTYEVVKRYPALARQIWIAEATRRLELGAKPNAAAWEYLIPGQAIRAIANIFGPELVPVLERIAKQSTDKVTFLGMYRKVEFYNVRSLAAEILTEKTGRQYTFVDVDGRTHPGGWKPSQEQ